MEQDYSTSLGQPSHSLAHPPQPSQPPQSASTGPPNAGMSGMMPSPYPYDPSYSNIQPYPPYPQSGIIDDPLRPQPYPTPPSHPSFGYPMHGLPTSSTRTRRDSGPESAALAPVFDQTANPDSANPGPYSGRYFRPPPLPPAQVDEGPRMGQYIAYGHPPPVANGSQMSVPPLPTMAPPMPYDWRPPSDMSNALHSRRSTFSATGMSGNDNTSEADGSQSDSAPTNLRMTTRGGDKRTRGKAGNGQGSAKKGKMTVKQEEDDDDVLEHVDPDEEKIDHRRKRRNRTIRSCVPCHNHKRKCDRKRPCGRCTALGLTGTCVYEVDDVRDMNDPTIAESERLRRRIAELEQVVRELRQRQPNRSTATSVAPPPLRHTGSNTSEGDVGPDSKKRRVIVDRFARFRVDEAALMAVESAQAHAETGDLGINGTEDRRASGHSRDSSREDKAGSGRDKAGSDTEKKDYGAEPYTTYLLPGEEMVHDRMGRRTFLGAAAGQSMLRRLREITTNNTSGAVGEDSELLSIPEESAFKGVFPDMRKTFPFTTIWSHENFSGEIIGLLPDKEQSEVLLATWEEEVSAFFLAWHIPSLRADFRKFFGMSTTEKMNVPLSSLSLYLMICSLGCVMRATRSEIFGDPDGVDESPRKSRDPKDLTSSRLQSELYLSGAYQALRLCSFMSNPSLASIQAQILINIYLFNTERAADAWAQTGSLVRQCIAMGLHVDPARLDAKISLREAEVRRRIWWTVAGLDALLCVSFGRPSVINFYQTNLPQDRTDDNLSDAPGTAQRLLPPSNVLSNETTDMTYHAAYFQLTIPSYELLDRMFHVDRTYSRSAIYGWFSPAPDSMRQKEDGRDSIHTYEDAIRLAKDINQWYAQIPRGMRFDAEEDTPESLRTQSVKRVNQRLILCSKTFMVVMVLHRPYLRFDPAAYPESSEICYKAAHQVLAAYRIGAYAKASILWAWWTVSYRAFHAGAVCAFLAIRQPGTDLARRCMEDLRGAITVFEGQMPAWKNAHPVQTDLRSGLKKLEQLATLATRQRSSPLIKTSTDVVPNPDLLSVNWSNDPHGAPASDSGLLHGNQQSTMLGGNMMGGIGTAMPLSEIRGFPELTGTSPGASGSGLPSNTTPFTGHTGSTGDVLVPSPMALPTPDLGDGFGGGDVGSLPQFWASVFGIKLEHQDGEYPPVLGTATGDQVQGLPSTGAPM